MRKNNKYTTTRVFVTVFVSLAAITTFSSLITSIHLPSPNSSNSLGTTNALEAANGHYHNNNEHVMISTKKKKKNASTFFSSNNNHHRPGAVVAAHYSFSSKNRSSKKNTTLVVVIGNLRGGEQAWESLCTNVLDPSQADLALLIGEFDENDKNNSASVKITHSSLYQRAKYIWTFPEYQDWADAMDLINGSTSSSSWREILLPIHLKRRTGFLGGVKGTPRNKGSGAMIMMFRYFLQQHLKEDGLVSSSSSYDRFVITRSDHFYPCLHNISSFHPLGKRHVWIPSGSNFGGYTDRHLIVAREDVMDALDIFPTFFRHPETLMTRTHWNPESLIKAIWKNYKNLTVFEFPRTFFTCALASDSTRWKKASREVPGQPGLLQKYTEEFNATQENCPAKLLSRHDSLLTLWEEYQYGSRERKAARYFTPEEQTIDYSNLYKQRNVLWQCMKQLGGRPDVVMDRISRFLSSTHESSSTTSKSVDDIIHAMNQDDVLRQNVCQ